MMRSLSNTFWLGAKELRSFFSDWVLLGFVIYSFSLAVISQAQSNSQELFHASIAIVDEDHSELSRRITRAFMMPYFKEPVQIARSDIEHLMNAGRFTFVIEIPPNFQRDVLESRQPGLLINVDATAMVQAGLGSKAILYRGAGLDVVWPEFLCRRRHRLAVSGIVAFSLPFRAELGVVLRPYRDLIRPWDAVDLRQHGDIASIFNATGGKKCEHPSSSSYWRLPAHSQMLHSAPRPRMRCQNSIS
jgi:hypothetical protein